MHPVKDNLSWRHVKKTSQEQQSMELIAADYVWGDAPREADMGRLPGADEQHRLFDELTWRGSSVVRWEGALEGRPDYQCLRGWCNMLGLGMPIDNQCARYWYGKAAEQGHGLATMLACWTSVEPGHEDNYNALVSWLHRKAENGNIICATCWLMGHVYDKIRPHQDPLFLLERMATQPWGARAKCLLGTCHFFGLCGLQVDQQRGFRLFLKAAEMEFPHAQEQAGSCYLNGTGVPKSRDDAFRWFTKAASQNLAAGKYGLAKILYVELRGMTRLRTLKTMAVTSMAARHALTLFEESASQGCSLAHKALQEDERLCRLCRKRLALNGRLLFGDGVHVLRSINAQKVAAIEYTLFY
eukprot:jgi/Mesen1/7667/ME000401S07006